MHGASHPAYGGLVRAFVRSTEECASSAEHRARLRSVDVDGGVRTRVCAPGSEQEQAASAPLVGRAAAPGPMSATLSIPVTTEWALRALGVAARLGRRQQAREEGE